MLTAASSCKASLPASVAAASPSTLTSPMQASFTVLRNIQMNTQNAATLKVSIAIALYFVSLERAGFQAVVLSAQLSEQWLLLDVRIVKLSSLYRPLVHPAYPRKGRKNPQDKNNMGHEAECGPRSVCQLDCLHKYVCICLCEHCAVTLLLSASSPGCSNSNILALPLDNTGNH